MPANETREKTGFVTVISQLQPTLNIVFVEITYMPTPDLPPHFVNEALAEKVVAVSQAAGRAIMRIYQSPDKLQVDTKVDDSPVTKADLAAHAVLAPALTSFLEGVPVLSEESALPPFEVRRQWPCYWIIDPLDGTKEFINGNGEFTVNVALIARGVPVFGVVHVPTLGTTYVGTPGQGAWRLEDGKRIEIQTRTIASRQQENLPIEVVASRRHGAEAVEQVLQRIGAALGQVTTKSMGSSLKLCLVAEGKADLYPRLALTSEWDTAAAQAVVVAAGGQVVDDKFEALKYNGKDDILNPYFYVIGDTTYDWRTLILS